jgi:hypothetical protein
MRKLDKCLNRFLFYVLVPLMAAIVLFCVVMAIIQAFKGNW